MSFSLHKTTLLFLFGLTDYAFLRSDVSRTSNISVSSYLRTAAAVQSQDDMGNDLLMARVDLTPMLDGHVSSVSHPAFFILLPPPYSTHRTNGIAPLQVPVLSTSRSISNKHATSL